MNVTFEDFERVSSSDLLQYTSIHDVTVSLSQAEEFQTCCTERTQQVLGWETNISALFVSFCRLLVLHGFALCIGFGSELGKCGGRSYCMVMPRIAT